MSLSDDEKKNLATLADFQKTFSTEEGHRVLRWLMKKAGFLRTTLEESPYLTAFNEGQRAIVIEIVRKMKIDYRKLEMELLNTPQGESDVSI